MKLTLYQAIKNKPKQSLAADINPNRLPQSGQEIEVRTKQTPTLN